MHFTFKTLPDQTRDCTLISYSTSCGQLTPWFCPTESQCPSPDAVERSLIYGKIEPFEAVCVHPATMLHNGNTLFCYDKSQINCNIMQPYLLLCPQHAGDGLVLMPSTFLRSLMSFSVISCGCVIGCCCFSQHSRSQSFTSGFYFESGHLQF